MLCVMLFLMFNVISYGRNVRCTYAERAVTLLPCEFESVIAQPVGRVSLQH